jgi:3-oxoacyl-[acyl-carrier protein] reductase
MLILITGTSRGIGRALREQLAQSGHTALGCSRRSLATHGDVGTHFQVDLTSPEQVKRMFRRIKEEYGFIDALINNAGTSIMNPFLLTPDSEIERIFQLNVFATFYCTREAVKLMRHSKHESPSIINVSTVAVPWSIPGQAIYASSKIAVEQAARTLSRELADLNIRINTIGLPPVRTALTRSVETLKIDALVERQAIKRLCTVSDIMGPIEFLLSPAARFVTGSTLFLGGVL